MKIIFVFALLAIAASSASAQFDVLGQSMASMDDVDDEDFSPHQATTKESMNSKDDVKVQPSSRQTANKGNYYMAT
uniref:Uncharacterized protein n=1 Tax=Oryza nivara TaxID=4536 RepID=A0A0E0IW35_ORYNI